MMDLYYVSKKARPFGNLELHEEHCYFMPDAKKRKFLGFFLNYQEALSIARTKYKRITGCSHCNKKYHYN